MIYSLIIGLLTSLLAIMQSPEVSVETKSMIFNQTLPVVNSLIMEKEAQEAKPEGEIGTATSTEAAIPSVGSESAPEAPQQPIEAPKVKTPGGVNVEA